MVVVEEQGIEIILEELRQWGVPLVQKGLEGLKELQKMNAFFEKYCSVLAQLSEDDRAAYRSWFNEIGLNEPKLNEHRHLFVQAFGCRGIPSKMPYLIEDQFYSLEDILSQIFVDSDPVFKKIKAGKLYLKKSKTEFVPLESADGLGQEELGQERFQFRLVGASPSGFGYRCLRNYLPHFKKYIDTEEYPYWVSKVVAGVYNPFCSSPLDITLSEQLYLLRH